MRPLAAAAVVPLALALVACGRQSPASSEKRLATTANATCRQSHGLLRESVESHPTNVEIGIEWPRLAPGTKLRGLLRANDRLPRVRQLLAEIAEREHGLTMLKSTGGKISQRQAKLLVRRLEAVQAKIEADFTALGMTNCV